MGATVVRPHGQQAQRGVGEQVTDVDRGRPVEAREILGDAPPTVVELGLGAVPARQLRAQQRHRRVVGRRQREPVLAEHLEGHALVHLAGVVGMREQLDVGVRVHVDEAGRENQPVAVERPPRSLVDDPDARDAVAAHADVRPVPRVSRAVDDVRSAEAQVEHARHPSRMAQPGRLLALGGIRIELGVPHKCPKRSGVPSATASRAPARYGSRLRLRSRTRSR